MIATLVALGPRIVAAVLARGIRIDVEGLHNLPRRGPALLAARHYHHLYDGVALVRTLPRAIRLFVALDWARDARQRRGMELLCALAGWPVALRPENLGADATSAYAEQDVIGYNRRALAQSARLLQRGRVVAVFPEAYPTIDPAGSRKPDETALLPFRPGLLAIAAAAERDGRTRVPIVPAGFHYREGANGKPASIALRLGVPRFLAARSERRALLAELAASVRKLSHP